MQSRCVTPVHRDGHCDRNRRAPGRSGTECHSVTVAVTTTTMSVIKPRQLKLLLFLLVKSLSRAADPMSCPGASIGARRPVTVVPLKHD